MIPLAEAQGYVLAGCPTLAPREVALADAVGLVLAAPVVAPYPVPPFTTSSMDGYALRAVDVTGAPVQLAVVDTVLAGAAPTRPVGEGEAVRIMTGAPLPTGADAVCMVERTTALDGGASVVIEEPVAAGTAVRPAGGDVVAGQTVFSPGEVLSPGHVGVLASLGVYEVRVQPSPTVGVLSTGDELVEGPGELAPGKIRDANRHSLLAVLRRDGFSATDLGIVGDDPSAIAAAVTAGARTCDALVTSGGVSVGDVDYVKSVLDELSGGAMRWMQVAIRPAKPQAFGNLAADGTPVFGLPGNPVSVLVSYELFVRPGLRKMAGHDRLGRPRVMARADEDLTRSPDGKLHLVRVLVDVDDEGRTRVRPHRAQESHLLSGMAGSNGLALVPDGDGVAAGFEVEVLLLEADELAAAPVPLSPSGHPARSGAR